MRNTKLVRFAAAAGAILALSGCSRLDGTYYVDNAIYADFDLAKDRNIVFDEVSRVRNLGSSDGENPEGVANYPEDHRNVFRMRVYGQMQLYGTPGDEYPKYTLTDGEIVELEDKGLGDWMLVRSTDGSELGYTNEGFMKAIAPDCEVYGELPIEYGMAKTNWDTFVPAYSHLVDIRKYFRCYVSTDPSNEGVDLSKYDLKISMKLSTYDTSIGQPFYTRNLCMLQYDILPMLKKAIEIFAADGYKVVIYDAYRPTSVQQKWFNVIRVHKWVADPSIGMGGIHDRGTAIDMTLMDAEGNELDMPTPMHTFTDESARSSTSMTDEQRANMDYMTNVMVSCGFTYIGSEWWHFQDVNTQNYLPTDHPIDQIPLVPSSR